MSLYNVEHEDALGAWKLGVRRLIAEGGEVNNLITVITAPCNARADWLSDYSPHKVIASADDARDVANTIFPAKLAARVSGRAELYEQYLLRHDRSHRWVRGRHAWGTYFERLVRFPPTGINQLERAIQKLSKWQTRNTTGLVFHLASPVTDPPRTRGGPCWHYGELLWNAGDSVDLVAVYRNHDFFNKVLGNFVGLGRLLQFICNEAGKQPGRLVCHSVHAYHDSSKSAIRALAA